MAGKDKVNKISVGNCGEYFVAAELERHGFSVAVPMSNTELFDILAFDRTTHKQFAIQVKTTQSKKREWTLTSKNEAIKDANVIYFFVALNDKDSPKYHIVPSRIVADDISSGYQKWLNTPGRAGRPHKENTIRKFKDEQEEFVDNWDAFRV